LMRGLRKIPDVVRINRTKGSAPGNRKNSNVKLYSQ